jgi:hypothetical protein
MELNPSIFLFYYYRELWRNARERERLASELAVEVSGVFELRPAECEPTPEESSRKHGPSSKAR